MIKNCILDKAVKFIISLSVLLLLTSIFSANACAKGNDKIEMAYFYIESCPSCQPNRQFIDDFESELHLRYPKLNIVIYRYNIYYGGSLNIFKSYMKAYGVENIHVPAVFIGDTCLSTDAEIRQKLPSLVEGYVNGTKEYNKIKVNIISESQVTSEEREKFNAFKPLAVASAGLLDGFNPCAISMLLFFLSLLVLSERQNKELIYVGASYILGTFLAYFAIGVGLFKIGDIFRNAKAVMVFIYALTVGISVILAILSFGDYLSIKNGKYERIKLQLPQKIRHTIQHYIKENVFKGFLFISTFLAGIVVSGLEFYNAPTCQDNFLAFLS